MSEKRFTFEYDDGQWGVPLFYDDGKKLCFDDVVDLLNEQQSTISKQLDQIIELQDKYRILEFNHSRLEKRNKAQYEKIGEQQATISQLKQENEKLKEERQRLIYHLNKEPKR